MGLSQRPPSKSTAAMDVLYYGGALVLLLSSLISTGNALTDIANGKPSYCVSIGETLSFAVTSGDVELSSQFHWQHIANCNGRTHTIAHRRHSSYVSELTVNVTNRSFAGTYVARDGNKKQLYDVFVIQNSTDKKIVGDEAVLSCDVQVEGGSDLLEKPGVKISWHRRYDNGTEKDPLDSSQDGRYRTFNLSTASGNLALLTIKKLTAGDAGKYICRAHVDGSSCDRTFETAVILPENEMPKAADEPNTKTETSELTQDDPRCKSSSSVKTSSLSCVLLAVGVALFTMIHR